MAEPTTDLPFTGERYVPELGGEIRLEHIHRYRWSAKFAADLDVVDIACGEGFGSAILANAAKTVIGIDVDESVVAHAAARYNHVNLRFLSADATHLPLGNSCADLFVSFETIEHLGDHTGMIAEIKRCLRPNGLLILSSPNKANYTIRQEHQNNYHVRELEISELTHLLSENFQHVEIARQQLSIVSRLTTATSQPGQYETLVDNFGGDLDGAMYFVALASDVPLPRFNSSLMLTEGYDVYWELKDRITSMRREIARDKTISLGARSTPLIDQVLASDLFDQHYYRNKVGLMEASTSELAMHYLSEGENAGLSPSEDFSPTHYFQLHPDVASSGVGALEHYLRWGRYEGRSYR